MIIYVPLGVAIGAICLVILTYIMYLILNHITSWECVFYGFLSYWALYNFLIDNKVICIVIGVILAIGLYVLTKKFLPFYIFLSAFDFLAFSGIWIYAATEADENQIVYLIFLAVTLPIFSLIFHVSHFRHRMDTIEWFKDALGIGEQEDDFQVYYNGML
jgi:hypothetical protein